MDQQPKSKKVVIVEDNQDLAEIYKTRIELLGHKVSVASDGIAALYLIQKELPDLVLLDLMVPAVAGDEILKRMRSSDWGKSIPVFIISNLNEADAPAGLRALNITGYVVKAELSGDGLDKIVNAVLETPDIQELGPAPQTGPMANSEMSTPPSNTASSETSDGDSVHHEPL